MQTTEAGPDGPSTERVRPLTHRPRRPARVPAVAVVLCLALTSLGALVGYWFSARGEEVHTAKAVVLLRPLEGNAFSPESAGSELVNMETEGQLVSSSVVTGLAAERLGTPGQADEIRSGATGTVPANTQLVTISATGADEAEAVDRAQVLAETLLAYRGERAESDVFDRSARLREEIRSREQQRRQVAEQLGNTRPDTPRALVRKQRISEITTQLGEFRVQLAELEATSSDPGEVVTTASAVAPGPLSQPAVLPLLGGAAGLAVALLLLASRRRLDERVHGPADLAHAGVPVLGRLPHASGERARAVGGVRTAVLAAEPARPLVIGVAAGAARDHEGDLATTADLTGELGMSMRRAGMVVAVLDLASRPDGASRTPGASKASLHTDPLLPLSALLDAEQDLTEVLGGRRASGLPLAVVNDLGADELADRASSPEMASMLAAMRGVADAVIADIGSLGEESAQSLVGAVDAVVLAVREGGSTFSELETALQRTPMWGGRLAGLVCVAEEDDRRVRSSGRGRGRRRRDTEPHTSAAEAMRSGPEGGSPAAPVSTHVPEDPP